MTDFSVNGPVLEMVIGTAGQDRLTYRLVSGPGGVVLDPLTPSAGGGYDGTFQPTDGDATSFTGIEHFTFIDKVGGDDTITTGDGSDILTGRAGSDILTGGGGSDEITGGNGRDRLFGGTEGDTLEGGNGNDRLFGAAGHDTIYGGNGNDRIYGGIDHDVIEGGAGDDLINGGSGDDFIVGGAGDDRLFGGRGADFIIASQGADVVDAGNGNDQVETAFDAIKTLDGGNGRDMLMAFYEGTATDFLSFDLGTGKFISTVANIASTTARDFEDFAFNGDIDTLIVGTNGANQLFGGFGDDTLRGKKGSDALFGSDGDDRLIGNKKGDHLDGGLDDDILTGGGGKDTFVFNGGHDVITDFKDDADTIQIQASLLADGTTVSDLIDSATVVDGNTVIAIDADNVLTIEGLGDPSLLSDDLLIY